ncbi:MAG: hypothetical protein KAT34_14670 [Candidatus Aminicenantes bacterium]|nr:hypothetical protein [Candidatus Aminicenantes bacterium]
MKYKTGDKIPAEEMLTRLQDEDGAVFLELRGDRNHLVRVGDNDSLFFRVEKTAELMRKLRVVEDYRRVEDYTGDLRKEVEPEIEPSDEITLKIDVAKLQKKLDEITFEEGKKIPDGLKSQCKKSTYGGYSLEYNNFFYVLDADFRVEIKKPVILAGDNYTLEAEEPVPAVQQNESIIEPDIRKKVSLDKGDVLPNHLRSRCEVDLSAGSGFRIEIGSSLYILDEDYRVVVKMSQSSQAAEVPSPVVPPVQEEVKKPNSPHPPEKIVDSVLKKFKIALKVDKINAELFEEKNLTTGNKPVLIKVYQGDLSELNEDTKASANRGRVAKLEEGSISLLKAALIHELYLKSTFRGRGEQMVEFLTHIISPWQDAALTITQADLSLSEQEKLVDFLNKQSEVYSDIGDILYRVYTEIKGNIHDEYDVVKKEGKTLFKAFLVDKLYQMISRPEKGDGISLIYLSRDIMDFQAHGAGSW